MSRNLKLHHRSVCVLSGYQLKCLNVCFYLYCSFTKTISLIFTFSSADNNAIKNRISQPLLQTTETTTTAQTCDWRLWLGISDVGLWPWPGLKAYKGRPWALGSRPWHLKPRQSVLSLPFLAWVWTPWL
jgi:hypothetical protein